MRIILVAAIAAISATTAMAGPKVVGVTNVHHIDTTLYYITSGPVPSGIEYTSDASGAVQKSAPVSASGNAIVQTGITQGNQNAVYAQLLAEAKKRGLR